jgi:hypothetical protein
MKRSFSISTVLVLLCSMVSPAWATGMGTTQTSFCHRMVMQEGPAKNPGKHAHMHHCDGMDKAATDSSDLVSIAPSHSHYCPMNCCEQGTPKSGVAISAVSFLPPLAIVEAEFHSLSVVFATAGFSSHTDRGPPVA